MLEEIETGNKKAGQERKGKQRRGEEKGKEVCRHKGIKREIEKDIRRVKESRGKKEECRIQIKEGTDKVRYRRGEMKNRDTGKRKEVGDRLGKETNEGGGRKKYEERKKKKRPRDRKERKGKERRR